MIGSVNLRVRYQETDQMGVVYNANYLVWFEIGRTELCRSLGISYAQMEAMGVFLPVVESYCRYRGSAKYDDLITVNTSIAKLTPVRIEFQYQIYKDEELLVEGSTVHGFTSKESKLLKLSRSHPSVWSLLQRAYIK